MALSLPAPRSSGVKLGAAVVGALVVLAVLLWQALAMGGSPDPDAHGLSPSAVALSSGVLVFREGLEAILVLAAVTAGLARTKRDYWPPVLVGVAAALIATVVTWSVAVALIASVNAPEYAVQAGTGLLAIVVLLVVMNWFFHKLYWTGWIGSHTKRRKEIFAQPDASPARVNWGLALLGFTAIYREGFEIVLFLQDLRLKAGTPVILGGVSVGLVLTGIVAVLTFAAHRKLPYKRMLVATGALLAVVLVVMVGESVQEMQQAGWIGAHAAHLAIPDWMGVWFAAFPNVEGLAAQAAALAVVVGSYAWVRASVQKGNKDELTVMPAAV